MEIKRGNTVVCDVYLKENSYTVEEVMGEFTLTLNFLSRNVVDLQINDTVDFDGNTYKIRHNEKVTKRETSLGYEYNVTLYSSRYDLQDVQFFLHGTPERKKNFDYYTGTARDWLTLLVKNMNRAGSGWVAGSCIESRMITLSFKDKKVGSVLDELIKELDTEYWISGKTVSIGKREYASNGLILGQGEGMGFTELEVSAVDDTPPATVLYPYGSDKNLGTDYGSDYLLLPGGALSLEKNVEKYGRIEQSVQFDHIFPKGEFTVTEKIDSLTLKSDINFNLKECLLDDVEVIVTFQDGGLAGYDLAIVEGSWDDATKQFKLKVNEQENALKVPGDINFSVGDKFILTGLKMPQSYIYKSQQQLQEEAQAYLDSKCEKRIQLRGKCDEVIFRLQNLFITCGQMVGVYSEQLKIDREIRVTRVKRFIENDNKPCYRYELTLSDFLQSNGFKDMVDNVNKMPEEIEDSVRPVREWSKRSYHDVKETQEMMFDPDGSFKTEYTAALMAEFAHLLVGSKSQQMDLPGIKFIPNADNDPNYFKSTAGKLVHFTIRESIAEWTIPVSTHRLSNSIAYYVYAKCSRTTSNGSIYVTDRKIKLEEDPEYYHFWIGVLNTPEDGVRSWGPLYGYTEIAGQTITTGVIKDKLARLVIDLVNAKITAMNGATIEGAITFTSGSSGLDNVAEWPAAKKAIEDAQLTADDAVKEIGDTNKALSGFENTVNGAFKDGIIETAEAKAIEKYINTLNTEKADADAVYNKLYANAYLSGTPKTDLLNSKITYNGAHTNLINSVNTAIADGRTTVAEKADVDSKFTAYKNALADYKTKVEAANKAIQDTLKGYSDSALKEAQNASTAAGNAQTSADNAGKSVTTLNTYVDGAFKDGIITTAEAKAIEKYLNTVKAEKASVEATYNKLYVNAYLSGTAKTGLLNAKVTLFGSIDNLLASINAAISDGKTTVAEKNDVDSKFTAFNTALSSFNTAVETANKAIQDALKGYSDEAYNTGYNALTKANTAQSTANNAQNAADNAQSTANNAVSEAAKKAAAAEKAAKDALAYRFGYNNFSEMAAVARLKETFIDGGIIRTALIDAAAIVVKGLSAEMIQALNIVTGKLTVTTGAKIADFRVNEGQLKYVGTGFSSTAKIYMGDVESGNPDSGNARITALGVNINSYIAGSGVLTTDINNMIIDNKSSGNKKTTFVIKTVGGAKNTALAAYGNVTVNGNVTGLGIPLTDAIPNSGAGFDHNCCLLGSGSFTLPTGESIKDWFGNGSNWWTNYGTGGAGGVDAQDYDLYVCAAYWNTGNTRINGNSGGNSDYSGISGTPLYGIGVVRSGQGYVELKPGQCAHFKKVRRAWYCLGVG